MAKKVLVADLLCGAGGSSTGCSLALAELGLKMELVCVNHWGVAIETHKKNHPLARHYCQDISTVRPHLIVPEGYLDLLMASPTCTHHSVARGGKPTSDQQRSDPWHIITWLTELRVKRMIIENVWEFVGWGPVDHRTGKPIKERKGEYFNAWIDTIRRIGFEPEWRKLNAADAGEATERRRFFLMARNDRKVVSWPTATHAKAVDGTLSLFPTIKPWRPAREIIDWSRKGRSIFGRPKPLAPKTLERILAGAIKFGWPVELVMLLMPEIERSLVYSINKEFADRHKKRGLDKRKKVRVRVARSVGRLRRLLSESIVVRPLNAANAMLVTLRQNADGKSLGLPLPAIAAEGTHMAIAQPIILANRNNNAAKDAGVSPAPCFTTAPGGGVALAEAFVVSPRHGKEGAGPRPRLVGNPLPGITAGGSQTAVVEPVIINGRKNNKAKAVSIDPVPTLDTKGGVWLAEPLVLSQHSTGAPRSPAQPLPAIMTGGAGSEKRPGCARPILVEPFIATVAHGNEDHERNPNSRRVQSVLDPLGALHGGGGKYGLAEGTFILSRHGGGAPRPTGEPTPTQVAKHSHILISPYYSNGSGETCRSAESPLPSPTTIARFGMVLPVTHSDGSDRSRDVDVDPIPTVTTANRGELAFIAAQFGERDGQTPRVHDIDRPAPGICATGHITLVQASDFDILFRMLEPPELAAAMGFDTDDAKYEFAGTKTEQIKQIGNAVSVKQMRACVRTIMSDAAPKKQKRPARQNKTQELRSGAA